MMKNECMGHKVAYILVIVGALNWGLIGFFQFNLVNKLFNSVSWLERLVYVLVGVAAVMMLFKCKCCGGEKCCGEGKCSHDEPKKS